jgi:hypothetical protein
MIPPTFSQKNSWATRAAKKKTIIRDLTQLFVGPSDTNSKNFNLKCSVSNLNYSKDFYKAVKRTFRSRCHASPEKKYENLTTFCFLTLVAK